MAITIQATYENGVLHGDKLLPFHEKQRIKLTIQEPVVAGNSGYGMIQWTALSPCLSP